MRQRRLHCFGEGRYFPASHFRKDRDGNIIHFRDVAVLHYNTGEPVEPDHIPGTTEESPVMKILLPLGRYRSGRAIIQPLGRRKEGQAKYRRAIIQPLSGKDEDIAIHKLLGTHLRARLGGIASLNSGLKTKLTKRSLKKLDRGPLK